MLKVFITGPFLIATLVVDNANWLACRRGREGPEKGVWLGKGMEINGTVDVLRNTV